MCVWFFLKGLFASGSQITFVKNKCSGSLVKRNAVVCLFFVLLGIDNCRVLSSCILTK